MNNEVRIMNNGGGDGRDEFSSHNSLFTIHNSNPLRRGFTLIELLIVTALMVTLTVVGVMAAGRYRGSQDIKLTLHELSASVNDAKKRSIAQEDGLAWGIRFTNTTSSQKYEVFQGSSYTGGTVKRWHPLSTRSVQFSSPYTSSTIDLAFAARTGKLSARQIVSIVTAAADAFMGDVIVNTLGSVTTRFENGIVGYWHFDEGTATTTYDASGQGNNGAIISGTAWNGEANCKAGKCLGLTNTTDKVTINSSSILNTDTHTIMFWFKPTQGQAADWRQIIAYRPPGTDRSPGIWLCPSGSVSWGIHWRYGPGNTGTTCAGPSGESTSFTIGTWYHIAGVKNGSSFTLYVNGSPVATPTVANPKTTGSAPIDIGQTVYSSVVFNIDELRVYKRALTATEVLSMYNDLR